MDSYDPECPKCGTLLEYSDGDGVAPEHLYCPECMNSAYDPNNPETVIGEIE